MQKFIASSCALIALVCVLALYQVRPVHAADDERPTKRSFEYATLYRTGSAAGWYAPGANRSTAKAFDLYRELGGKEVEKFFDNSELLSLIGQQGWELVTVTDDAKGNVSFYFKRSY